MLSAAFLAAALSSLRSLIGRPHRLPMAGAAVLALGFLPVALAQTASTTMLAITSGGSPVTSVSSGAVVTLTASVVAGGVPVTRGAVTFCDAKAAHCTDIHIIGTAQLTASGTATFRYIPGPGSHSYSAVFAGTRAVASSVSPVESLTVSAPGGLSPTVMSLTASGSPSDYTISATVSGSGGNVPTGTVSFVNVTNGNTLLGTGTISSAGGLSFVNSSNPLTGQGPRAIGVGDFNGDGVPDLAVTNRNSNDLTILLGNGDGTFTQTVASPATGSNPVSIAVADFNSDGKLDLAVSNLLGNSLAVLLGNGDGTFTPAATNPTTGAEPISITTADFNGDGIPDLAALDYSGTSVTILLGNGDGTFASANSNPSVNTYSQSMVAGDLNGDGIPDLAVAGATSNSVSVFLGNGDGTFTAMVPNHITSPVFVAIADVNGDGKPDLAVETSNLTGGVTILLGKGDGTFMPSTQGQISAATANSVAVADFNGDGVPDLAVAEKGNNLLAILSGKGDGTFAVSPNPPTTGASPFMVATADFNGDGVPDIAVTDNASATLSTFLVDPDPASTSISGISALTNQGPVQVLAKYSGDNFNTASSDTITLNKPTPLVILTASAVSFIYGTPVTLTSTVASTGVLPTGIVAFYDGTVLLGAVYLSGGSASLTTALIPAGSQNVHAQYAGDNNYAAGRSSVVSLAVAQANPTMIITARYSNYFVATVSGAGATPTGSVFFGDDPDRHPICGAVPLNNIGVAICQLPVNYSVIFDYSGDSNYLSCEVESPEIPAICGIQTTTTSLAVSPGPTVASGAQIKLSATLTGCIVQSLNFCDFVVFYDNGRLVGDVQVGASGEAVLALTPALGAHLYRAEYQGNPSTTSSESGLSRLFAIGVQTITSLSTGGSTASYALSAIVGGNLSTPPTGSVSFLDKSNGGLSVGQAMLDTGAADLSFMGFSSVATGAAPRPVAVGDFNKDGFLDLAVANQSGNTVTILLGNGNGGFTPTSASPATGSAPVSIAVADFNGDGNLDLAVLNLGSATVTILLGNGSGGFTAAAASPATGSKPLSITTADFNRDGRADLAIANEGGTTVTVLLGNGDGTFTAAASPASGLNAEFIASADLNRDGKPDIVVAASGSNVLTVLLGNGDGTFTAAPNAASGLYPSALAIGDLNGDGVPDIAVTNYSPANAVTVLLGNGDGTFTVAPASAATVNSPGSIGIADVNLDGIPDLVVANKGSNNLTVLLGNNNGGIGNGTFTQSSVSPATGQTPFYLALADFNGDGVPDIAVTNSGSNTVSTLLTENQSGTASVSGIVLPVGTGVHQVVASYSGDSNYSASVSPAVSLSAVQTGASVGVALSANPVVVGTSVTITARVTGSTATPSGAVTFLDGTKQLATAALNSSGVATYTTTALAVGQHSITVSYAGNADYSSATSPAIVLTVNAIPPTITFSIPNKTYGAAPFTILATSNSKGAIAYAVASGPATISGTTVTLTGAGKVAIQASQAASGNYAAGAKTATFTVSPETPTITFTVPNQTYGAKPFTVSATSNSPGTFTYSVVSGPATISGATVTLTGTGTVALRASQAATANFAAASKTTTFTVSKESQTITFPAPPSPVTYGVSPITLKATASSGLAVVYSVTGPAKVSGSTLTITGAGTVVVTASQAGSSDYSAATPVSHTVVVNPAG